MSKCIYAYIGTIAGLRQELACEENKAKYAVDNGIECEYNTES